MVYVHNIHTVKYHFFLKKTANFDIKVLVFTKKNEYKVLKNSGLTHKKPNEKSEKTEKRMLKYT